MSLHYHAKNPISASAWAVRYNTLLERSGPDDVVRPFLNSSATDNGHTGYIGCYRRLVRRHGSVDAYVSHDRAQGGATQNLEAIAQLTRDKAFEHFYGYDQAASALPDRARRS